jgi:hypothetical protein
MELGKPLRTVVVEPIAKSKEQQSTQKPLPITPKR